MAGSRSYWKRRHERDKAEQVNRTEDYLQKKQGQYYRQAEKEIREEIEKLYQRFADSQDITLAQARQRIREADFKKIDFEAMAKESLRLKKQMQDKGLAKEVLEAVTKQHEDLEAQIAAYAKRGRISYLELKSLEIDRILTGLYDRNQASIYDYLTSEWEDNYYRQIFNTQQYLGFGMDFVRPNEAAVRKAVLNTYDKGSYSKRLYGHCRNFSADLKQNLTVGLIRGEDLDKMAGRISRRMGVAQSAAKTLVRTETAYVFEQATMEAYEQCGIEWYEYLATLDGKTTPMCQELDGKHFRVRDAVPGKNCPPMHPNCRSTTVCWFSGEEEQKAKTKRIAKNEEGKYYFVPADMTYQQWRRQQKDKTQFLSYSEKRALTQYTSFEAYKINEKLRKHMPLSKEEQQMADRLNSALDKLDNYEGDVVRCVDIQNQEELEIFLQEHQKGKEVIYEAFTSASMEEGYNPDANIRIYMKSKNGKDLSAFNSSEKEVLYKSNQKFLVTGYAKEDGIFYILMEEKDV